MKLGVIGRAERRGLGIVLSEFARNMKPDKVLLVRPQSAIDAGLSGHPEWYAEEGLTKVVWNGAPLDERMLREWVDGLDVIYFMEQAYDWKICDYARDAGARTVCHTNPEYMKHVPNVYNRFAYDMPAPDRWWNPTCYRQDHLPPGTRVVPVPIALDRFADKTPPNAQGVPTWLHVVGSRAASDRNGTLIFMEALRHLKQEHRVILRSQGEALYPNGGVGRKVHVESHATDLTEWWDLYADADALVMPRRYGGLSMPALEAMGAGLALVMPAVPPNTSWPAILLPAEYPNHITTSAGSIAICAVDPVELATKLDWLAAHPASIRGAQRDARNYAQVHSWDALRPTIVDELERVCA